MEKIKIHIFITTLAFFACLFATMFSVANTRLVLLNTKVTQSVIKGLEEGTKISYVIVPKNQDVSQNHPVILSDSVLANSDGIALLPSFNNDFKSYTISVENDKTPIVLNVSHNSKTERLNIKGSGFEKFADVFISKGSMLRETKTDWAGLFSDSEIWHDQRFGHQESVKLAFSGFAMNDGFTDDNPLKLEVVINQGGLVGPGNVNVYNPAIHDYNCGEPIFSTDGDDTFYVSTCDVARMQAQMADGACNGGPPCTSTADTLEQLIVHPLMLMAEQLSAVMMQQMAILGSLIDAKDQNEVFRDFRHLAAEAHKDYHPSEQMCRFGSYVRSISHAEEASHASKKAFNQIFSAHVRGTDNLSSSEGYTLDMNSRLQQFKDHYCNPNDNAGALWQMCRDTAITDPPAVSGTAAERLRYNKDIDFFETLDKPLTLDVNMQNAVASDDEEDLIALAKNLYWPTMNNFAPFDQYEELFADNYPLLLQTRSITGKLKLAQNSFSSIVGMKTRSENPVLGVDSGSSHMKALLREFGLTDPDIELLMGDNPSYYAQMEILAKKIYQNPTFYTNLYDKPVNIDRINASLEAFQNMHMRDRYESQLRQEMLISMLVEDAVMERVREINSRIPRISATTAKTQDGTGF